MKRLIVALFVLMFTLPAFAQGLQSRQLDNAGWKKLTESQKAAVLQQVTDTAEKTVEKAIDNVTNPEKLSKWVGLGEQIGKMIGSAAKEVNVAVNEFVKSPVGMLTMALIVWHYMGATLIHVFGGLFIFFAGMSFILIMLRRATSYTREYDTEKKDIFGRSVLKRVSRAALPDGSQGGYMLSAAAVLAVSIIAVFSF